jgi:hypothetical protein
MQRISKWEKRWIKQRRRYRNWLRRLRVGDAIMAHYDGKWGRGCQAVVVAVLNKGTVDVRLVPYCGEAGALAQARFRRGDGWVTGDSELGIMRSLGCEGDFYRLRPVDPNNPPAVPSATVMELSNILRASRD